MGKDLGTKLTPQEEVKYQQWRTKLPRNLQYEGDYDLRGLWKSNPDVQPSPNLHFPDTYKLPNHPTFSNESIYFNDSTRNNAGHWDETDSSWNYIPFNPAIKDTIVEKKAYGGIMKYARKRKRIARYDDGGAIDPVTGKKLYYDEYGNLLDHPPDTTYEDAKASSQNTTNAAVAGVTAWNPIIGGISGAAQSVGRGMREKNEAKDEYGRYEDPHKVGTGAVSGGLFDPLSGALEDWKRGDTWGGIESLISPGTRAFKRGKEYEKEAKEHNAEIDEALKQKKFREDTIRSQNVLANYDTHGVAGAEYYVRDGGWIQHAINPAHKGYCTPMTKSTCTGHRRALAMRFKSGDLSKHWDGGVIETYGSRGIANGGAPIAMDEMEIPEKKQKNPGMYGVGGALRTTVKENEIVGDDKAGYGYGRDVQYARVPVSSPSSIDRKYYQEGDKYYMDMGDSTHRPITETTYRFGVNKTKHADGGKLVPLASDAVLAVGDTHGQDTNRDGKTGITLQDNKGRDYAEVEDDEVIVGNKVFSKRLGYAPLAESIAKEKGELENTYKGTPKGYAKNTLKRNIEKKEISLNQLFGHQEASKVKYACGGRMKYGSGGLFRKKYTEGTGGYDSNTGEYSPGVYEGTELNPSVYSTAGNVAAGLTPYIDNYFNSTIKRPSIPVPEDNVHIPLKTTVNFNPQLNEVDSNLAAYNRDIDDNTANSAVGNALKGAQYANALRQKNSILANKENIETNLFNTDTQLKEGVQNYNRGLHNKYAMLNMQRKADIQDAASANVANATNDAVQGVIDNRNYNLDNKKIELMTKTNSLNNDAAIYQSWNDIKEIARRDPSFRATLKNSIASRKNTSTMALYNQEFPDDIIK